MEGARPLLAGGAAAVAAGVLWTVGAFATPPEVVFITLLIVTFLCGTGTALVAARNAIARKNARLWPAAVLGAGAAATCFLFVG